MYQVCVTFNDDLGTRAKALTENGSTISYHIRKALEEYLDKVECKQQSK